MIEYSSKIVTLGLLLLICLGAVLRSPFDSGNDTRRQIGQVETDSIRYELFVVEDSEGVASEYMAEIFTPVCHTNKCYPVYINFFWDLLGNFDRFEMPEGERLTKLDHIPFEDQDYEKLQAILSNENSLLGDYPIEELVVSTETVNETGVDAVTGATSKTIQNDVISGAVYSCHTLWHLAHGELTRRTKSYTIENATEETLVRFLKSGHHPYQYWAIAKVQAMGRENDPLFAAPLLEILRGNNIFLARHLLEQLPEKMLDSPERQQWLWETFEQSPYRLQMDILARIEEMNVSPKLVTQLLQHLEIGNPAQQQRILTIIEKQDDLEREQQQLALRSLESGKWEKEMIQLLANQKNPGPGVKKALKKYTVTNQ